MDEWNRIMRYQDAFMALSTFAAEVEANRYTDKLGNSPDRKSAIQAEIQELSDELDQAEPKVYKTMIRGDWTPEGFTDESCEAIHEFRRIEKDLMQDKPAELDIKKRYATLYNDLKGTVRVMKSRNEVFRLRVMFQLKQIYLAKLESKEAPRVTDNGEGSTTKKKPGRRLKYPKQTEWVKSYCKEHKDELREKYLNNPHATSKEIRSVLKNKMRENPNLFDNQKIAPVDTLKGWINLK